MTDLIEFKNCPICDERILSHETRVVMNYGRATFYPDDGEIEFEELGWQDDNCIGGDDDGVRCISEHTLEDMAAYLMSKKGTE